MVESQQISPGMTLSIRGKLFRVESVVKVTVPKGTPFIKAKLRDVESDKLQEKNFKLKQQVKAVELIERELEFLYPESSDYLFLDINDLEIVGIPSQVIADRINFLKEGVELKASFYGDVVFSVEMPQFLELMIVDADSTDDSVPVANATKQATLETGASVEVPPFVEVGDIIKVDTRSGEFIQRV